MKEESKNNFFKSLITDNPIFMLGLGLCSTIVVTKTFENAYIMGIFVFLVLLFSNMIMSLVSKNIPRYIRIPFFILIVSILVTLLKLFTSNYIPKLDQSLGIYLPLIVINCIILERGLAYASNNTLGKSVIDALRMGIGFMIAISLLGLIRELLGNNTITLMDNISTFTGYYSKYSIFPNNDIIPNNLFLTPAGSFITIGLLIGMVRILTNRGVKK